MSTSSHSPFSRSARRLLRLTLVVVAVVLGVAAAPARASAEAKIAVIDLRRAVADTEDGLRVRAKLQQLFDSRQADYESKEKAYAEAKTEFEGLQKNAKTSENELRKKYAALEKMAFDLRAAQYNYQRELQQQENELMYPIIKQMLTLVRRLAATNGYDMVLNKDAVPYHRADHEITDRIIQMYNSSQASETPGKKDKGRGKDGKPKPKTEAPTRSGSARAKRR
jgi:outer membrane protein